MKFKNDIQPSGSALGARVGRLWSKMAISSPITVFNLWSPGGSRIVQKMAISFPIPVFKGLKDFTVTWINP